MFCNQILYNQDYIIKHYDFKSKITIKKKINNQNFQSKINAFEHKKKLGFLILHLVPLRIVHIYRNVASDI